MDLDNPEYLLHEIFYERVLAANIRWGAPILGTPER